MKPASERARALPADDSPPTQLPFAAARDRRGRAVVAVVATSFAALFGALALRRYDTFHAQIDLAYYVRLVWGLGHGRFDLPLVRASNVLGLHLEPILLPLALVGRAGVPIAPLLLVVQAAAVALVAWPAARLGARHLGSPVVGAAVALLYPTVTVAALHDFHPVTLALAPLLGVADALDEGRRRRALVLGAVALACREDVALQLAALAVVESLRARGRARLGAALLAATLVALFVGYVVVVQPRYVPASGSYGLHFQLGGAPARSGRDVLAFALAHPLALLAHVVTVERLAYPLALLAPVALLPLLAPRLLAGALPVAAISLLSDLPRVRTVEAHYTTAIAPFVVAAALVGAGRLRRLLERTAAPAEISPPLDGAARRSAAGVLPAALLLVAVAVGHARHGGSPLAFASARFDARDFRPGPDDAGLRAAVAAVAPNASVAAPVGALAHLAARPRAVATARYPEWSDGLPVDVTLPETP